jgi:hypothetical protein
MAMQKTVKFTLVSFLVLTSVASLAYLPSVSVAATCSEYKVRLSNQSAKDAATDIPSWAAGERPCKTPNEDGKAFATRLLTAKYGAGKYPTGAGSEYSKLQKFGDRAF